MIHPDLLRPASACAQLLQHADDAPDRHAPFDLNGHDPRVYSSITVSTRDVWPVAKVSLAKSNAER
jgi:hypothetical protein